MDRIKFGTDGWRALIAQNFTVANVTRLSEAAALWLLRLNGNPSVVIGYDTRFGGKMFAEAAAKVFAHRNIKVFLAKDYVTTPMVSFSVTQLGSMLGMMITASHNSGSYNGIKLKGFYGGSLFNDVLKNIQDLIPAENTIDLDLIKWDKMIEKKQIEITDIEHLYVNWLSANFNLPGLIDSNVSICLDVMYGSAQSAIKKILPGVPLLHDQLDPNFGGGKPEPVEENLKELSARLAKNKKYQLGIAFDGDGDRLAVIDSDGTFIPTHQILLVLIHYLVRIRVQKGKVLLSASSSILVDRLCVSLQTESERVKAGFRNMAKIMVNEPVLIACEESGGIALPDHIPDRDGLWTALLLWQILVESGMSLADLLGEVHRITGTTAYGKVNFKSSKENNQAVIDRLARKQFKHFGDFHVKETEDLDGVRYIFNDWEWVLIRISGTEPLIRIYAEMENRERTEQVLAAVTESLKSI